MEQEPQAVGRGGTGRTGLGDESRHRGSVHEVHDEHARVQRREREGLAGGTDRRRVHDEVRTLGDGVREVDRPHAVRDRAGERREFRGLRAVADRDRHALRPRAHEREDAGTRGATRTVDEGRGAVCVEREVLAEPPLEARRIGVVADEAVVGHDDRVHRAEGLRVVAPTIDEPSRPRLVRHRDARAAQSERREPREGRGEIVGFHREGHVGPIQTEGAERGSVDRRREAPLDGPADDPHDLRRAGGHPRHALSRRNCA